MENCIICGMPGGCRNVGQAAKCKNNKRGLSKTSMFGVFAIAVSLWWLFGCASPNPEFYPSLSESEALSIIATGAAEGKQYIATKNSDGTFTVKQVEDF